MKESEYDIRLIALDLDGTTLNSKGQLTEKTKAALEDVIRRGIILIIATGRAYTALPEDVFKIGGIRYIMTSNGASVMDFAEDELIYSNCVGPEALETVVGLLRQYDFMIEVFIRGVAYVEQRVYDNILSTTFTERHKQYIIRTRKPVRGLMDFALAHKALVENINVNFEDQSDRARMREILGKLEDVTLTTSFDHNLEIGGATTSKGEAIRALCGRFGVEAAQVMACGDNPNDLAMLRMAGLPVAMGNAKEELKAIAGFVTKNNDEDGVAFAIEMFVKP